MDEYAKWAAAAEDAVVGRHLRSLWCIPATRLGVNGWPPDLNQRLHRNWNYWWQAHVLDCLVDAELRAPSQRRARAIKRLARTIWLRNRLSWTNNYYDDMAWLGLALHRAHDATGMKVSRPLTAIGDELHTAFTRDAGGGLWWRRNDDYKNAPANGPAAILHARLSEPEHAAEIVDWLTQRLVDPETGLVWDGLHVDRETGEIYRMTKRIYTYCQGVYLGACLELARVYDNPVWLERAERTIAAVAGTLAPNGVLRGHGGGDGGLFSGILARYLAFAVRELPAGRAADTARDLVLASADACWTNAALAPGGPLFGPDWAKPVSVPTADPKLPAQHLSVQAGGWMVLEAAASLTARQERKGPVTS